VVVDANDGIVAIAGIVEGFIGAGAGTSAALVAAWAGTLAGGIALGSAKYTEVAIERDALGSLIEEERQQLSSSPDEELDELASHYEQRGLAPDLARQVAEQLSRKDALAAHAEVELGIGRLDALPRPIASALLSAAAFVAGALIVVLTVVVIPTSWWVPATFIAVAVSLSITSFLLARLGELSLGRTLVRTVSIGLGAMLITYGIGSTFDL
jgi:VIT1/CCC1 family predicted Fe2+/Mn2+ transporter